MNKCSILTICVNYNNDTKTQQFVSELLAQKGDFSQKVIIVDNSESPSFDSPLYNLFKSDSRVLIINSGKNLGYYGGAAWGLREYIKEFPLPEWIIICNIDIDLIQPDLLSNLRALYSASHYAIIAPAIISAVSGRDQNPYMRTRPTRLRMHFYKWTFRYYPISMIYQLLALLKNKILFILKRALVRSNTNSGQKFLVPQQIYAPHGSFVVYNRKYFESGGTLDHGVFLFGEEIFIAETAKRLGLTIAYDPRLQIKHQEHSTTNIFKSRKILGFVREAAEYCANTFFR
ncbi:MAG: glycosyltransferase [Thermodesulfovibrionales bacterium]|nr:glycosyltransferase [Thermodesulfovibrionales bacterium]